MPEIDEQQDIELDPTTLEQDEHDEFAVGDSGEELDEADEEGDEAGDDEAGDDDAEHEDEDDAEEEEGDEVTDDAAA